MIADVGAVLGLGGIPTMNDNSVHGFTPYRLNRGQAPLPQGMHSTPAFANLTHKKAVPG
jgi:hypothetical protein